MSAKLPVTILGATGTVGQKCVRLLADHPWGEVAAVAAASASAGRPYGEVVRWREAVPLPDRIAGLTVLECVPPLAGPIAFSALDADVAGPIEQAFARAGAYVVSNARNHRMEPDVPLVGTAYSYLQEYLPHVAQAVVREGWVDLVGIGRLVLSDWELPAKVLAGEDYRGDKKICRTFSDCTTAPRNGIISGCFPLDEHYKNSPEMTELKAAKSALRERLQSGHPS